MSTTAPSPPPPAATTPPAAAAPLSRGRRWTVRVLLVLATILAVVSVFAVWANRQVLNADNWANTSTALLENSAIRSEVSAYLVDQVYSNVDVTGQVASALPRRLKPLAGPAANGLRELAQTRMDKVLGRPRVQEAWKTANRVTAQQFINIAEGKSKAITLSGNAVILDLRVILVDLVNRLGLPSSLSSKIPASAGKVKIMSANQISTVQDGVNALRGLAFVLPLLSIALLALAVFLARGNRRRTLLFAGFDLVLAGILVLIARNVIGSSVVDSLTSTEAQRPAAEAVWSIGTGMLHDVAQAAIIMGIPVILAAWLAGPTRPAVAFRRTAAPWLRERPGLTYAVAAVLVLLVIAWGPIPATRMVIPVLLMIALVALGVHVLRVQTAQEFPDATVEGTQASMHAAVERARGALRREHRPAAPATAPAEQQRLEQLERLRTLHDSGALTDEEFAAEKASVLANGART
ncbi:MAG: SHOCT domain-containing protein [Solirubrobacteraceae bacterium]